jgi:RsiW-degrading membrane proteinase PrsW (M82 family)
VDVLDYAIRIAVSLVPVVLFLLTLIALDSYKLVRARDLVLAILVGCGIALLCLSINDFLIRALAIPRVTFSRYGAPPIEELAKTGFVLWLVRRGRIGFLVDAAIVGFAVGTGFALIENAYYVQILETDNTLVWIIRGLGTAVMHGGVTAIGAVVAKGVFDRSGGRRFWFLPGLLLATVLHSMFNHFVLGPVGETILLHAVMPPLIALVFWHSERSTRRWLGSQMDVDAELLEIIQSGRVAESRIGRYLDAVRHQVPPAVLVDMLCYLRLRVELAIAAKGLLMMRAAGFKAAVPEGTREKFVELRHLEKTIGPTGRLAMAPCFHQSTRDLWQIYHLES